MATEAERETQAATVELTLRELPWASGRLAVAQVATAEAQFWADWRDAHRAARWDGIAARVLTMTPAEFAECRAAAELAKGSSRRGTAGAIALDLSANV